MSYEILKDHRCIWQNKKILRDIYNDWYTLIVENMADKRPVLEIGSGGGTSRSFSLMLYPLILFFANGTI